MSECAFCASTAAKLSGEHIWSQWMRKLFRGKRFRFARTDAQGKVVAQWLQPGIDMAANVVCEPCNNGWMSNLENQTSLALADIIVGKRELDITPAPGKDDCMVRFQNRRSR